MKLGIKNFRNIDAETIEGKRVHIQGKNGSGKSNILHAVERVLFATIHGSKQGIQPVMFGKDTCKVELTLGDTTYDREPGNTTAYLDSMRRAIMYCDLLNQEYTYIKKVITEILIQDKAKELFGELWMGSVAASITAVKRAYTEKNNLFLSMKSRTEFLQLEIEKRDHVTTEGLEAMEQQLAEKKFIAAKYINAAGDDMSGLKKQLEEYQEQLRHTEKMYAERKLSLSRGLSDLSALMEQGKKLTNNICPTCGQPFESKEQVDKLRDEYADKKLECEKIQGTLDSVDLQIKKINTGIADVTARLNELQVANADVMVSKDTIEKEVATLWESIIRYAEALKLKNGYDDELQKTINDLITLQSDPVFIVNDYISPKGKLNQLLQEELGQLIPGCEIRIIEDNELTGEQKSVFRLFVDDVEYRDLSRSQKYQINIALSRKLLEISKMQLPLLIDDAEMFSTSNIAKLKGELMKSGVEYIITKVCNCSMKITEF